MSDMELSNAHFIQKLNDNIHVLDKNIQYLETTIKTLAKDIAAMQRATIEFLKEKDLIATEEDILLFQKLHLRNIAKIDQEAAEMRDRNNPNQSDI
jgi:metal-dependent amidase/aminoacylase/carboxypeptidase family protein